MSERSLAPGEWAVLGLICECPAHGWALGRDLSPTGEVGSVWSLGRPLVYRSIEILSGRGLIEPVTHEPGVRGPNRTIFRITPAGRLAFGRWLDEPVEHVRDVRSLLLLKLVFMDRASLDPTPMLTAQRETIATAVRSLEEGVRDGAGTEATLLRYRLESTRAVLRFVEGLLDAPELATAVYVR